MWVRQCDFDGETDFLPPIPGASLLTKSLCRPLSQRNRKSTKTA